MVRCVCRVSFAAVWYSWAAKRILFLHSQLSKPAMYTFCFLYWMHWTGYYVYYFWTTIKISWTFRTCHELLYGWLWLFGSSVILFLSCLAHSEYRNTAIFLLFYEWYDYRLPAFNGSNMKWHKFLLLINGGKRE